MSTNCIVGQGTPEKFTAQYVHCDGYPSGVGKAIFDNWGGTFDGDSKALAAFLLLSRYGWSNLADTDFELKPAWDDVADRPQWYDTRKDGELDGEQGYWTQDDNLSGISYAYFVDVKQETLQVYGVNYPSNNFKLLATLSANDTPNWKAIESASNNG